MTAGLAEPPVTDPVVDRAVAGDDAAFSALVERHRGELHGHCRRMLSAERAEDALQEALLRAWRARSHFAGRATFRTWLYRIATNACLDEMRHDHRRPGRPGTSADEDPTREPASSDPGPDALLETGEAIGSACRRLIDLLPPRQRAVLILCEVLRCSSGEAAHLLGTTVAAVNSARQRARAALNEARPPSAREPRPAAGLDATDRALLDRYVDALRRHDVAAVMTLAVADAGQAGPTVRTACSRPCPGNG
jgi:RNA polymerase sigma-70 factor (ECF subfamily)